MQNLVIVESPTKAKTLSKYLGKGYEIEASMGHVIDLPRGELGVDTENNFEPKYIIPRAKKKKAGELKKLAGMAKNIWLASDPDREGEAIAWHLSNLFQKDLSKQIPIKRVVFHEITEEAIKEAFKHPRDLDLKLVDAQQARRILDRLVGYKLSPLLWKKIKKGLSAGRVQSVALRLIVEREREFLSFKPEEYWIIEAELESKKSQSKFIATLISQNGKKIVIKNKKESDTHVKNLEKVDYFISKIIKKEVKRNPYPPFTTSTMQQSASNKFGFTAKKTMNLAQNLYEQGFITYMRTDSFNLAASAISSVRDYINQSFGKDYLPKSPKIYKSKSKNAQEAHEAIRPTNASLKSGELKNKGDFSHDHLKLYDLIWNRFVSCQMSEAIMDQTSVEVTASTYLLRASGSVIKFDGWLKLYQKETDDKQDEEKILPELIEQEPLNLIKILPNQHFTEPPARFNEASLIKKLEELGIGRPSTYAPILSTIQERFYVERLERRFIPTVLGMTVSDFLMRYFSNIIDFNFTAQMEQELDEIATGERSWQPTIKTFYTPFEKKLEETGEKAEKVEMKVELANRKCPECGKDLIIKTGKFGKFAACISFPECKHTESLEIVDVKCPTDGGSIVIRKTKTGKTFYGCKNWPTCTYASWTKPKTDSTPESVIKKV